MKEDQDGTKETKANASKKVTPRDMQNHKYAGREEKNLQQKG